MPKAVRLGDFCIGHISFSLPIPSGSDGENSQVPRLVFFPPRPCSTGSFDVFVNDIAAHRVSDIWANHPHPGITITGSPTVFVNDLPKARVGDLVSCGSLILQGSSDVEVET